MGVCKYCRWRVALLATVIVFLLLASARAKDQKKSARTRITQLPTRRSPRRPDLHQTNRWPIFSSQFPLRRQPKQSNCSRRKLGFRMELVAHEPDVTDPVAACFDENGGMYVAEMIDYPYRPKEGQTPLGRIRYLQDTDDDGLYDKSTVFAEHIAWPTGVVCWKGGVYVAAAPDIWYLKDEDGDHRADVRKKIFTGFGDRNQQGGVNNLNWHVDHPSTALVQKTVATFGRSASRAHRRSFCLIAIFASIRYQAASRR